MHPQIQESFSRRAESSAASRMRFPIFVREDESSRIDQWHRDDKHTLVGANIIAPCQNGDRPAHTVWHLPREGGHSPKYRTVPYLYSKAPTSRPRRRPIPPLTMTSSPSHGRRGAGSTVVRSVAVPRPHSRRSSSPFPRAHPHSDRLRLQCNKQARQL